MRTTFDENEIPYEKFASIGLSQEMVDDLPEMVMKNYWRDIGLLFYPSAWIWVTAYREQFRPVLNLKEEVVLLTS